MSHMEAENLIRKSESCDQYYDVLNELGRGRFAVVKKCVCKKTGKSYAAKIIKKSRTNSHGRSGREQLLLEIDILSKSNHPKMVRLYDVFETRSEMQLILEFAEGGDLHRHCIEGDVTRTEKEICYLIRQIVDAVRYLHDQLIVHLDLKPDNILLAKACEVFPEIRLIDFGLSRRLDGPYSQFDIVGTPEYVAPEVLAFEPIDFGSDMWSVGVVTYVLLSGISPFAGDDVMETYANIGMVEYDFDCEEFDEISDEAIDFIEKLLIREPKKRLTAREAAEHPWLKQLDGGISAADVLQAQHAQSQHPEEVEINPLVEEDYLSSSESETPVEKSSATINGGFNHEVLEDYNEKVGGRNVDEVVCPDIPTCLSEDKHGQPAVEAKLNTKVDNVSEHTHEVTRESNDIENKQDGIQILQEQTLSRDVCQEHAEVELADNSGNFEITQETSLAVSPIMKDVEEEEVIAEKKSQETDTKSSSPKIGKKPTKLEIVKKSVPVPHNQSKTSEESAPVLGSETKKGTLEISKKPVAVPKKESYVKKLEGKLNKTMEIQGETMPITVSVDGSKEEILNKKQSEPLSDKKLNDEKQSPHSSPKQPAKSLSTDSASMPSVTDKKLPTKSKAEESRSPEKRLLKPDTTGILGVKLSTVGKTKQAFELAQKADAMKGVKPLQNRLDRQASSKSTSSTSTPGSFSPRSGSSKSSANTSPVLSRKTEAKTTEPLATAVETESKSSKTTFDDIPKVNDKSPYVSVRKQENDTSKSPVLSIYCGAQASSTNTRAGDNQKLRSQSQVITSKELTNRTETKSPQPLRDGSNENTKTPNGRPLQTRSTMPIIPSGSVRRKIPDGIAAKMAGKFSHLQEVDVSDGSKENSSPKVSPKVEHAKGETERLSSPKPTATVTEVSKETPSKPIESIMVSMNIGGSVSVAGRKLNVGPLISSASSEKKKVKVDNQSKEEEQEIEEENDTPLKMRNNSSKIILGVGKPNRVKSEEKSSIDNFEDSDIGDKNDDDVKRAPALRDLRGKSQSISRRRADSSPNSPRKTYRRLYVTKVRNSKLYDPDFNIMNTEAAKIMQRVDNDVLQVELRLKSTDLKLLP